MILTSIPIEYYSRFRQGAVHQRAILVYTISNTIIITFLDNVIIIQGNVVAVLDSTSPLQLPCSNTSKYIVLSRDAQQYTAFCGQDALYWSQLCSYVEPTTLDYKDFIAWKNTFLPNDQRVLVEHVINYVYSRGFIPDTRRKLFLQ